MKILFLDDEKYRHNEFAQNAIGATVTHVYSADEAIRELQTNEYSLVFLDHDLEPAHYRERKPEDKDGQYIADKIVELDIELPFIVIHSLNPLGAAKMLEKLGTLYRSRAIYVPMGWKFFAVTQNGWSFNYNFPD